MFESKKTRMGLIALLAAIALSAMFGLTACGGSGSASSDVPAEDRTNAKQVIMAAGDLFTMMDLGLTDADSPATISQNDPQYEEFWAALQDYKKVADLDVKDASVTVTIQAVEAATAREDSTQVNYRYTVTDATMTVNGQTITYNDGNGFSM